MKQRTKRLMALMLTLSLTAGGVVSPVAAADDPYKQAEAATDDPYKQAEKEADADTPGGIVPSKDAKYTITVTDDNWIKVENEGGDTLGLSQTSGVKLIEVDGYAFKDMNQNGELDAYEDWRLETGTCR